MTATSRDDSHRDTRRRFEQWARNPHCQANVISAVHNIRMADVVKQEGGTPTMGQSPFAIVRGQSFERTLFRNGGESLITALKKSDVLPDGAHGLEDLRLRLNGGNCRNLDESLAKTADLLRSIAHDDAQHTPWLVAGGTVRVPGGVMLPEAILVLDALVIRHDTRPRQLIVGEIKTYPDRAGHTDRAELATARAQAGVYVHGLDLVLEELRINAKFNVAREGFLVLTRPGFNQPSVRSGEDLRYQAERAKRGFELLRDAAQIVPSLDEHERFAAVVRADTQYCEACLSFCDRAQVCHAAAIQQGLPAVLGDDVSRFLGTVSLARAIQLMQGSEPLDAVERDLTRRITDIEGLKDLA
jgi:hypothetical protein